MKKQKLLVLLLAAVLLVSIVAMCACTKVETKVAYGLVHRKGYVGIATVKTQNGQLVEASIDEACFPSQVKAQAEDGEYTVKNGDNIFYKTVKAAGVTYVYDLEAGAYKVGTKTLQEHFATEDACKAYAEAVIANEVVVVTSAGEKKDIMTAKTLLKSQNGYWDGSSIHEGQLGWKSNVDATVKYVLENGFSGASAKEDFVSTDNSATNPNLDNEWKDKNGKLTGATWSDMWDYFSLLQTAFNK